MTWNDERRGAGIRDVYAARVDPQTGAVLERDGFPVTTSGSVEHAHVTAGQAEFLVGWSDERLGWPRRDDIIVARVGFDGGVLDPEGVNVVSEDGMDFLTSVGFDGTHFLVNSFRTRTAGGEPFEAVTRRLTRTLQLVAPGQVALFGPDPGYTHYTPRVVRVGASVLFVWERGPWPEVPGQGLEVLISRLPDDGGAIAEPPRLVSAQAWSQRIGAVAAGPGDSWVVLWSDPREGTEGLRARWFGPGPAALGPSFPVAAPVVSLGDAVAPAAVATQSGGGVLAVWAGPIDGGAEVRSRLLTTDGGPTQSVASTSGRIAGIFATPNGPGGYAGAWTAETAASTDVTVQALDGLGAPIGGGPERLASSGPASPFGAGFADDGSRGIVGWADLLRDATSELSWLAANRQGERHRFGPFDVPGRVAGVSVDLGDALAVVAWSANDDAGGVVYATRLDGDGGALDTPAASLAPERDPVGPPVAASRHGQALVVWPRLTPGAGWVIRGRLQA